MCPACSPASLHVYALPVAVRLTCFQFFGFKRKTPFLAYCKDVKETVDALSFAPTTELEQIKQQAQAEEASGFGGVISPAGEVPAALTRVVSRAKDQQNP
jgi:hypothetical protein